MRGLRVILGTLFCTLLLFPAPARQAPAASPSHPITASDIQALVEAIRDEIYAKNRQADGYDAGLPDGAGRYRLNLYVQPKFNEQGLAWAIYKLMPYGEVIRMFWIRRDGLAGLFVNPGTGYSPTQPSYLTVYMHDADLWRCKQTWLKKDFVIELHPSAARLHEALQRQKKRFGDSSSASSSRGNLSASPEYQDSLRAAEEAQNGPDPSHGATHFLLDYGQPLPAWAAGVAPVKTFGPFLKTLGGGAAPKDVKIKIVILP